MSTLWDIAGRNQRREWNTTLHEWKAFRHERSHLVTPKTPKESLAARLLSAQASDAEEDDRGMTDLLILGLVDRLPKPDGIWSLDDRGKWLRTAARIFDLVYKASDGEHREISIVLVNQEAAHPATTGVAAAKDGTSPGESNAPSTSGSPSKGDRADV